MADQKISQLTDGTSFQAGDEAVVNRSGTNFKVDPTQFGSSIDVTGTVTADGADLDGAVVINESGADVDFRVESDTVTNALFVRGSDGFIGIGTSSPHNLLTLDSNVANTAMTIRSSDSGVAAVVFGNQSDASSGRIVYDNSDNSMAFETNNLSEAMRIDSSGDVIIGDTSNVVKRTNAGPDYGGVVAPQLTIKDTAGSYGQVTILNGDGSGSNAPNLSFGHKNSAGNYTYGGTITLFAVDTTAASEDYVLAFSTQGGGANAAERMRLDASGNLLVGTTTSPSDTGTVVADGIYLGGTGAANLLDDYEEGTWTPTVSGTSSAGTGTYGIQNGYYTKIGNIVSIQGWISWTAHTGTGNLRLSSLPFTSSTETNNYSVLSVTYLDQLTLAAGNYINGAYIGPNSTQATFQQTPTGGGSTASVAMDTSAQFMFSATYRVS